MYLGKYILHILHNKDYELSTWIIFSSADIYIYIYNAVYIIYIYICRENEFEDGNHFYRFLEHEPFIPKCHNFRGVVNDCEPKAAGALSQRLACLMSAILESYASDDRSHLDYVGISNSEEFRR